MKQLNISKNIHRTEPVSGLHLHTMKMGRTAVTIMGSFLGGRSFNPDGNPMIADLVVLSLDEGTLKHTKEEIRDKLESIGASIEFSCGSNRIHFEARTTKEYVPLVISLLAEQLRYPAFSTRELSTIKKRSIAKLKHLQHETKPRAENSFLQALYPKKHPLYQPNFATKINLIKKISRQQLLDYHKRVFGLNSFNVVVVGDINTSLINTAVKSSFGTWKNFPHTALPARRRGKHPIKASLYVSVADKASTDVFIGSSLPITKQHKDYFALLLALKILGGGFTSRLMQTIREEKGLTYGIYASQIIEDRDTGHWLVWGTFAPKLLEQGSAAVMNVISIFAERGVLKHELTLMRENITGTYAVELSSTTGMAQVILADVEDERSHTFIDDFVEIISKIKLSHVNEVIKKYIHPDQLISVAAGSIDGRGKPL